MIDPRLTTLAGFAGSGKSTRIRDEIAALPDGTRACALTYTRDAAATLVQKGVECEAGTIYSVSWPHVKLVARLPVSRQQKAADYRLRPIRDQNDEALRTYVADAPGNHHTDPRLPELLSWAPYKGPPPPWLWSPRPGKSLGHALALARWLASGGNWCDGFTGYDKMRIDEAQDLAELELAACLQLLKPTGQCLAVGDPGQAIFLTSKGGRSGELPPAWVRCAKSNILAQGFRVGSPLAEAASAIIQPYYPCPADAFRAEHRTEIVPWVATHPPISGLVLTQSRRGSASVIEKWSLQNTPIVPAVLRPPGGLSVSTIHAAKGQEADDVYCAPWSRWAMDRLRDGDPEMRKLLYVLMTRARKRLHVPVELRAAMARLGAVV